MSIASDIRFWDRTSRKYAASVIADQGGYQRTVDRTRALLGAGDRVLELGCGTGTTALLLASGVREYLATDMSAGMIAIANEKHAAGPVPGLTFRTATVEAIDPDTARFNAILGFNYLHLVRDLPGTLRAVHGLLAAGGLFISKTPCVGEMNVLIPLALPVMRAVGLAPHASIFRKADLHQQVCGAGFDIVAVESHATKGKDIRPFIVARKT